MGRAWRPTVGVLLPSGQLKRAARSLSRCTSGLRSPVPMPSEHRQLGLITEVPAEDFSWERGASKEMWQKGVMHNFMSYFKMNQLGHTPQMVQGSPHEAWTPVA